MFPAPTIDSSEYTFGDTVGAAGCSKSRKRGGKFYVHEHFVIARACFIIFHSRPARVPVKIRKHTICGCRVACERKFINAIVACE